MGSKISTPIKQFAWVNFNGTTGAINDSSGVASVTRNNAGDYTIVWSKSFANANYCFVAWANVVTEFSMVNGPAANPLTTDQAHILIANRLGAVQDPTVVCAMATGDKW